MGRLHTKNCTGMSGGLRADSSGETWLPSYALFAYGYTSADCDCGDCETKLAPVLLASCTNVHASMVKATTMPRREIAMPASNMERRVTRAPALRFRSSHWTNVLWPALNTVLSTRRYGPASVTVVAFRFRGVSEIGKRSRGLRAECRR